MLRLAHLAVPSLREFHRIEIDSPEESTALLDNAGTGIYFLHAFGAHSHGMRLCEAGLTPAYTAMRRQIQILQYLKGGNGRWVLKCPFSLGHVQSFLENFPDAKIVFISRDVTASLSSVCQLSEALQTSFRRRVDRLSIGEFWRVFYRFSLENFWSQRAQINSQNVFNINYTELTRNPQKIVKQLGEALELRINGDQIDLALSTTQHSTRSHPFNLNRYGLDASEIKSQFSKFDTDSKF